MPLAKKAFDKNMSNPIVTQKKTQASAMELSANYNKPLVNFKGYFGDKQPAKKLFWILKGNNHVYEDNETHKTLYRNGNTGWKKWVAEKPENLLKRTPLDAIQSICTLTKKQQHYPEIPDYICNVSGGLAKKFEEFGIKPF